MTKAYVAAQDELFKTRLDTIEKLDYPSRYPYSFKPTTSASELQREFQNLAPGQTTDIEVSVAGRIMARRNLGKSIFYSIRDNGSAIQLYLDKKAGDNPLLEAEHGDIYGLRGKVMKTKTGELTIHVVGAQRLAKCLRPMPDKWHGLQDSETKSRMRHLDLLTGDDTLNVFLQRERIFNYMRKQLKDSDFVEVDTPILQPVYGGANARPFVTKHNALDQQMFLRISNELYLKRLIIGGIDRVFEFARDFRNEGMDATHNPEFTQLEIYQAYADYNDMMSLVEKLISTTAQEVTGNSTITYGTHTINLGSPWKKMSMEEAVAHYSGIQVSEIGDKALEALVKQRGIKHKGSFSHGRMVNSLFEHFVEPELIQPTIIYDYPVEISPLAKRHRSKEGLVERFEFFIAGREFGNAYSELNDPIEQRKRFEDQQVEKIGGDDEAHPLDEEFLKAMEYGMPPTGGLGIGMDRLVALLTNKNSIRDVLLFPMLRNKDNAQ